MNVDASCKFCRRGLVLEIDGDYAALGDPFKLLKMCACNRCADYYAARRVVMEQIKRIAMRHLGGGYSKEQLPLCHESFVALVKRYMRLLGDFKKAPLPDWDDGLIDALMAQPGNFGDILGRVPLMFSQPSLV